MTTKHEVSFDLIDWLFVAIALSAIGSFIAKGGLVVTVKHVSVCADSTKAVQS